MNADFWESGIRHLRGPKVFRKLKFSLCISKPLSQTSGESVRIVIPDFIVKAKLRNLSYEVKLVM